jgi:putative tricarboxylic transport membrane protein
MTRIRRAAPYILLLIVSFVLLWSLGRTPLDSVPEGTLGPIAWPKAIVLFMALLCAYETLKRLAGAKDQFTGFIERQEKAAERGEEVGGVKTLMAASIDESEEEDLPIQAWKLVGGLLLIGGYAVGISYVGFFVSSALFLSIFSAIGGFKHPIWNPVICVLGSFGFFFVFMRVAYISLPLGEGVFKDFSLLLLKLIGVS